MNVRKSRFQPTSNEGPGVGATYNTSSYNQAINDSRFVKGFGITALIYALVSILGLTLLGGGIGVGTGLFIMRYDSARYYRILGIVVIVFALIGALVPFLGAGVLSGAVLGKGLQVLIPQRGFVDSKRLIVALGCLALSSANLETSFKSRFLALRNKSLDEASL